MFKTYVDEFRKKQEEEQLRQNSSWKPSIGKDSFTMRKGDKFVQSSDRPRNVTLGPTEFKSKFNFLKIIFIQFLEGSNFAPISGEPKPMVERTILEFKKGERLINAPIESPLVRMEFTKGSNVQTATKEPEKKDTLFKRSEKVEPIPTSTTVEFARGSAFKKEEPKPETTAFPKRGEAIKTDSTPIIRRAAEPTKTDSTPIIRKAAEPTKTEPTPIIRKAPETIKTESTPIIRRTIETPKTTTTTATPKADGFARAGATQTAPKTTPTPTAKKTEDTTAKKTEDAWKRK
jgi:hypothetical protein